MKLRSRSRRYLLLEIVILIYISFVLSSDLFDISTDMKDMYLYYFSYNFIGEDIEILNIVISILPISIIIAMFSDVVSYELEKNSVYFFTRTKKRSKWLLKWFGDILLELVKVNFILFFISYIVFYLFGYRVVHINEFIYIVLKLFLSTILVQYILIILSNIVNIKLESVYGYITSNIIYIISILDLYFISLDNIKFIKFIPFTQNIVLTQDIKYIDRSIRYFSNFIAGYSFQEAMIYGFCILIILMLIGTRVIKTAEFY